MGAPLASTWAHWIVLTASEMDLEFSACNLGGDELGGLHGAVPADDKEEVDVHPLQGVDHFGDVLVAPG